MSQWFSSFVSSLCLLCNFAMTLSFNPVPPKTKELFQRTSDFGRIFIFVIPKMSIKADDTKGEVCFMTLQNIVKVSMIIPDDIFNNDTRYSEEIYYTRMKNTICVTINKITWGNTKDFVTGHVIKITAEYEITVLLSVFVKVKMWNKGFLILPPISSYSNHFLISLPHTHRYKPSFMVILSIHENTVATITFKNTQIITVNLNEFSFAIKSWKANDAYKLLYGAHVESQKPLLVLAGLQNLYGFTTMPSVASISTTFLMFSMNNWNIFRDTLYMTIQPWKRNENYTVEMKNLTSSVRSSRIIGGKPFTTFFRSFVNTVVEIKSSTLVSAIVYSNQIKHKDLNFVLPLIDERAWPDQVYFMIPYFFLDKELRLIINLLVQKSMVEGLLYNGKAASTALNSKTHASPTYKYFTGFIHTEARVMQADPRKTFAAYITCYNRKIVYNIATALGKINSRHAMDMMINDNDDKCHNQSEEMRPGDGIDNDCDFKFDEELWNGKDDDIDGLVDEDLLLDRVKGSWGSWQPWYCDCIVINSTAKVELKRYRSCDNPPQVNSGGICVGSYLEINNTHSATSCITNCHLKKKDDCPLGIYSGSCNIKCPKGCSMDTCEDSGQCLACKTGYRYMPYCEQENYNLNWTTPYNVINLNVIETVVKEQIDSYKSILPIISLLCLIVLLVYIAMRKDKKEQKRLGQSWEGKTKEDEEVINEEELYEYIEELVETIEEVDEEDETVEFL